MKNKFVTDIKNIKSNIKTNKENNESKIENNEQKYVLKIINKII
jgi:hypothetical protein